MSWPLCSAGAGAPRRSQEITRTRINLVSSEISVLEGLDPNKITINHNDRLNCQPRICVWFDLDTEQITTNRLYDLAQKLGELDDIIITAIRTPSEENLRIEIYLKP